MLSFLFDIDDTLYDQSIPFKRAYNVVFGNRYNLSPAEFFKTSRQFSNEIFEDYQQGRISLETLCIYRIKDALATYAIDIDEKTALDFQKIYAGFQKGIALSPEMIKILDLCTKAKLPLGIITNGPGELQWSKVKTLELTRWFASEHIFISGDLGISKPDVGIFRKAEQAMSLDRKHTYFIGDAAINDVGAAKNAGWKSIWMNRRFYTLPPEIPAPDFEVHTEADLGSLICKLIAETQQ